MRAKILFLSFVLLIATACSRPPPAASPGASQAPTLSSPLPAAPGAASESETRAPEAAQATPPFQEPLYLDPQQPIEARVNDLLSRMTLEEKLGQMTQIENNSLAPRDVTDYLIGSVLSGGDGYPTVDRSAQGWREMVDGYQQAALETRLAIPLIYGVDAIHGFGSMHGATLFPHNIGLGASRDVDLVERIGRATAAEMLATNIRWNFAPVVAVPQDIRWGRTYEGFSENTELAAHLGAAYLSGLQAGAPAGAQINVLATPKHFIGDGGTTWGTSTNNIMDHPFMLDQGDMQVDEATLRQLFLPPYQAAIDAGAASIMASFSSWNGIKVHANQVLLTGLLKDELGFQGFVVSDWGGIDQLPLASYTDKVSTAINAGIDMVMVPSDYQGFSAALLTAVESGDIPQERIDDAVRRILRAKFMLGLFEQPFSDPAALDKVGSAAHRELGREAVRKSVVLLKNENLALPLAKDSPLILVAGSAAKDIGMQAGGWTMGWQGSSGEIQPGTTILEGIQEIASPQARVLYNSAGKFSNAVDAAGKPLIADVGIVVLGEQPYAEGVGDQADLRLDDQGLIERMRSVSKKLILIVLSGRPVEITGLLPQVDSVLAAWWPGTEGGGVADLLFGDYPFTGKLPYTWPRWSSQLPFDFENLSTDGCSAPLFPFGYGLDTADPSPEIPECQP